MKRHLILIIGGLFLCTLNLYSQDNPNEEIVIKAAKTVIAFKFDQNELQDFIRYSEEPITYIQGKFTGMPRKECIAICPMMRQTGTTGAYQKFVILFYKNAGGTWTKGKFAVLEQEVDTMDLNNDKLPELICKSGFTWMGETHDKTTIYHLKNDTETIWYENESEEYSMFLEVGKEASKIYEISFIDSNNDGKKEIEEHLATGIIESIANDEPKLYYKKTNRVLKLINGKYQ